MTFDFQTFDFWTFDSQRANLMKSRFRSIAFLLLACCGIASYLPAQAPGNAFVIYGRIHLPNGESARRVVVKLSGASGMDRQVFSDDEGRYEFRDVPRGRYHVSASNPTDPQQFTDPVEADTGRSISTRLLVHVFLRFLPAAKGETAKATTVSVVEATQHIPKPARKAFEDAQKFKAGRKIDQAISSLDHSIELFPEYFQAWTERGHLRIAQGKYRDAAADFAKALEVNNRYGPALRGSGLCKFEQGKFAEAVMDLELATTVEPDVANTHLYLGIAQLALDHRVPARAALQQAVRIDPVGAARAHVHLADLNMRENKMHEAAAELRAYLEAAPNAPDAQKFRDIEAQIRAQLPKP